MLKVFQSADHISPATGATLTVTLSKNGAAFAAAGASVTERTSGWYQIALTTTDADTLGDLVVRATGSGCDDAERILQVEVDGLPSVSAIADGVWDEAISGHLAGGSTGSSLNAAGSAGDPWATTVPGAYGAGTAGKILGDNLNATVSSRASQTSLDTVDDLLDTEVAAIKAKTDLIPASPAAVGDIPSASTVAAAVWAYVVEGSYTAVQFMRLFMSALVNKSTGFGTGTWTFRDAADTKARITVAGDGVGNRTSVTTDVS